MALTDFEKKEKKQEAYEVIKLKKIVKGIKASEETEEKRNSNELTLIFKKPDFYLETKKENHYSIWHKPTIILPYEEKTREEKPDFVFIAEKTKHLYTLENLEKKIKTHKKMTEKMKKELSKELLKKMKKIKLLLYIRKNLTQKELTKIIITASYLKPEYAVIILEESMKPSIKIAMPEQINCIENTGINQQKAKKALRQVL